MRVFHGLYAMNRLLPRNRGAEMLFHFRSKGRHSCVPVCSVGLRRRQFPVRAVLSLPSIWCLVFSGSQGVLRIGSAYVIQLNFECGLTSQIGTTHRLLKGCSGPHCCGL